MSRKKISKTESYGIFPYILICVGVLLSCVWGLHRYLYSRSISLSDALIASYTRQDRGTSVPIHITIGTRISLPVVEAGMVNGMLSVSQTSANHLHDSAMPGQRGNIIIYGHNLNKIFGYLVDSRVGDPVSIRMTDGSLHTYRITDIHAVWPSQTELLEPTTSETLTLYTCTGLLDSLRFVARATPETK